MLDPDHLGNGIGDITYVPSPVSVLYKDIYSIELNKSGRLQYYKQPYNKKRIRITRTEFAKIYNSSRIMAIEPIQNSSYSGNHFLLKFFTL
jgi:hypothetical protein